MNIPPMINPPEQTGLDCLYQAALRPEDFALETEFLVPGFLPKRLITLIYADGGNGKSWLALALARRCVQRGQEVHYLDFDNPLSVLKERGVDKLIVDMALHANHPRALNYIQRSKCALTANQMLRSLSDYAQGNRLDERVIVLDSLRNLVHVSSEAQGMEVMTQLMNIREAGATVIILHHSNKDGQNYQGSNHLRNSVDNMYRLRKTAGDATSLTLHLEVIKERAAITDKAFVVDTTDLSLAESNITTATLSGEQKDFVQRATAALREAGRLNKSDLLKAAGKEKDDKTARGWLDQLDGLYWVSAKKSGVFSYQLAGENDGQA